MHVSTSPPLAHRPLLTAHCSPPIARRPLLILHSATQSLDPTAAPMDLASLQALPGNSFCADCSSTNPDWASCNNGVLLCLHCAGAHRGLGTHISFVQSVTMDTISPNNRLFIASSSNNAFHDFVYYNYMVNKPPTPCSAGDRVVIRAKYDNERANEYRNGLRKLANLDPVPYFPTQPNTTEFGGPTNSLHLPPQLPPPLLPFTRSSSSRSPLPSSSPTSSSPSFRTSQPSSTRPRPPPCSPQQTSLKSSSPTTLRPPPSPSSPQPSLSPSPSHVPTSCAAQCTSSSPFPSIAFTPSHISLTATSSFFSPSTLFYNGRFHGGECGVLVERYVWRGEGSGEFGVA